MFQWLRKYWVKLYIKKPFQKNFNTKEERAYKASVMSEGFRSEFWKIFVSEFECSIQSERNFSSRQLALKNVDGAMQSAMLAEAMLKVIQFPEMYLMINQDVLMSEEQIEKEKQNARPINSSRFS